MVKLNITSVVTVLLLNLIIRSTQADETNGPVQATPAPAPWDKLSCFNLLDGKNKTSTCRNDVLKFIGAIPRDGCGDYCHLSCECCIATVALDMFHPECWRYLMNKDASEKNRYLLVMTCAKSLPPV